MAIKYTTDDFVKKAYSIHGDKYDYSLSVYTISSAKVEIICRIHGAFMQTANSHLQGCDCPKCGAIIRDYKKFVLQNDFVSKAVLVHGQAYDYSFVNYARNNEPVLINCVIHGAFQQTPNTHLRGRGCPECGRRKTIEGTSKNKEYYLAKFLENHGNRYDYSLFNYTGAQAKSRIICPIHGVFQQAAIHHANGHGCFKCRRTAEDLPGWSRSLWAAQQKGRLATLYFVKLFSKQECFYKIGITLNSISKRFAAIKAYQYEVLATIESTDAIKIHELEEVIKRKFKTLRYLPAVKFCGSRECFSSREEIAGFLKSIQ